MNRSESKFKNTADKMHRALFSLLESKEFADMSIMDICKAADVNRSTFYAHYDNTYDLLKETFESTISNFRDECDFGDHVDLSDMRNIKKEDLNFATPQYLLPYLNYVKKHRQLYRIYNENAHAFEIGNMDDYLIENIFAPVYAKHGVSDKKLIRYMLKYFLAGIDAVINEWVRNDCEDDVLFICETIMLCVGSLSFKQE